MITGIIIAAVLVGGTGLIIGLLLGVAGKKFAVLLCRNAISLERSLIFKSVREKSDERYGFNRSRKTMPGSDGVDTPGRSY